MAAFETNTNGFWPDTSPTAPRSSSTIYIVITGGDYTISNTIDARSLVLSAPAACSDPPPILTKDEKRAQTRWMNWLGFWAFVDWLCRPRWTPRVPETQGKEKHTYGTMNGLRPVPMLC